MEALLRPLRDPRTPRAFAFFLLALPLGIFYFTFLMTVLSVGLATATIVVGLAILVASMYAWRHLARMERRLVGSLLAVEIADPYRPIRSDTRTGRIRERITDPATWKDLAYLLLHFPLAVVASLASATLVSTGVGLTLAPLYAWIIPGGLELGLVQITSLPGSVAVVPLGAAVLVAAGWAIERLARVWGGFATSLLGSSADPVLTERVTRLEGASARVYAAADDERRRLERDLHDGAQQRLVSLSLTLQMAKKRPGDGSGELLSRAEEEARLALSELRDLARGIHPAILTNLGLSAALADLGSRSTVPVTIESAPEQRLPQAVEAAVYFIVSEALANVAKHSKAEQATVSVQTDGPRLDVRVADDGVGGVTAGDGSGLQGLSDRAGALGGEVRIESPPEGGTVLHAALPITEEAVEPAAGPEDGVEVLDEAAADDRRTRAASLLRAHALAFGAGTAVLVSIWLLTRGDYFWPAWPLSVWLAALALHGWVALARPVITHGAVAEVAAPAPLATRLLAARRGVATRRAVAAVIVCFLVVVWALAGGGYFWPAWVLLGLGAIAAADTIVLGVRARG
jgi:signal transduction histidine kinase